MALCSPLELRATSLATPPRNLSAHRDGIKPHYGQWVGREVGMSFDPQPKREALHEDGLRLTLKRFPKDLVSHPYDRARMMFNREAAELRNAQLEMSEQPECSLSEEPFDMDAPL